MRKEYSKLVRDQIPAIIEARGAACATAILPTEEYRAALREKLIEEACEAAEADNGPALIAELADLHEVIAALLMAYNLSPEDVRAQQARKRAERGGFERRIQLLWVEE